ncbi:MAG: nucleoid-associated protein [Bacteroidota bacterium]
MLDYNMTTIRHLALHQVGNPQGEGDNFISNDLLELTDELHEDIKQYLLKPMKKVEERYHFQHHSDVKLNEIYSYATEIFNNPADLKQQSINILKHLAQQSTHPQIKPGDVYIAYFPDLVVDDEVVNAVGIFKAERKNKFLKLDPVDGTLQINKLEGANIEKLDKGCLILNTFKNDGYRVISVDNNPYDAMYWTHYFLGIEFVEDENFHTKLYLEMCNEFANEVVAQKENKKEQIQFLSDSVDYFSRSETFDAAEFEEEVLPNDELRTAFKDYQETFALDQVDQFPISQLAFKQAKRKIKTNIKLDTNIQIKLDMNDPASSEHFLERGYDEERGMFYYKVFFNDEQ